MGVEHSRACPLPSNLDGEHEKYRALWGASKLFMSSNPNSQAFHSNAKMETASVLFGAFVEKFSITKLNILEVFAGNGVASRILLSKLKIPVTIHKTDIEAFNGCLTCNAEDAIDIVGDKVDTLLMISPPPGEEYGDYFCIKKWTEQPHAKYLIFVGELGASDGSSGMYQYLTRHPVWKSIYREMFAGSSDIMGGPVIKEIFVFQKQ